MYITKTSDKPYIVATESKFQTVTMTLPEIHKSEGDPFSLPVIQSPKKDNVIPSISPKKGAKR